MNSTPRTERVTYRRVLELLPIAGGAAELLDAASREMRRMRGLPCTGGNSVSFIGLEELLAQEDALGRIYQAINSPALEAAYRATARTGRKFSAEEIPAVTQLFTPRWVVEFLLHNTLGRLWLEMYPESKLTWEWMVKGDISPRPPRPVKELRVCDPACGTMNFGLVAVDMLRKIYREEGYADAREIDQSILRHNLFGFDIDPTAVELGRKSLEIKIGTEIREHYLRVTDALFDLDLKNEFDVVVTNPPYLSARNLAPRLVARMKENYPTGWRDAYACFILKSLDLLRPGGRAGILCMHSFMFTGAFEKLRRKLSEATVETTAHFGPGLFDIGNPGTLQTVAMVLQKSRAEKPSVFFRLVDESEKCTALAGALRAGDSPLRFEISPAELAESPRGAWMYWAGPAVRRVFRQGRTLGEIAPPRQGLATTDNLRFVRYWWEVEPPGFGGPRARWIPYAKGGRFCRWYEAARHRVDWEEDGQRIKQAIVARYPYLNGQWSWVAKNSDWYGRSGITYSYLTSGHFSARLLEQGTFFDVAGSSLFPDDPLPLLGILNSATARQLLTGINPTVNFQVGDLRLLPIPESIADDLRIDVAHAVELSRRRDQGDETSPEFVRPPTWDEARDIAARLAEIERRIDRSVARNYGLEEEALAPKLRAFDQRQWQRQWISYAIGMYLGRWGGDRKAERLALSPLDRGLEEFIREVAGDAAVDLEAFLSREFLPWHNRLYHGRPVFWGFAGKGRVVIADGTRAGTETLGAILESVGGSLPAGWRRWGDDPIHLNLAPLGQWIADGKLRTSLATLAEELESGRFAFSQTSQWMREFGQIRKESNCESVPLR